MAKAKNSGKSGKGKGGSLAGAPRARDRAGAKRPRSELTELQENFCVKYAEQGFYNAAGALEAAGSRAKFGSRAVTASRWLKLAKVQTRLKALSKAADKRAEKQRGKAVASLAERKARLSAISRATPADLRGISIENGKLVFDDDDVRFAAKSRAQIVMVPDPNWDPKDPDASPQCPKVSAVLVDLDLMDPMKAIDMLNKIDGVYKESSVKPAEIHIHTGEGGLKHNEKTAGQLADSSMRVPMPGSAADKGRFRGKGMTRGQPVPADPFEALRKRG